MNDNTLIIDPDSKENDLLEISLDIVILSSSKKIVNFSLVGISDNTKVEKVINYYYLFNNNKCFKYKKAFFDVY